jgi:hypothetical protein
MGTSARRELAASIGSLTRWAAVTSKDSRTEALAPARQGRRKRLETQADPDGLLSPKELDLAVDRLQRAHYRRMALASVAARVGSRPTRQKRPTA